MVLDFLRFSGEEDIERKVSMARREFMQNLQAYCMSMQIVVNPRVVYRSQKDSSSIYPRWTTWMTDIQGGRKYGSERIRQSTQCCFFFRMNDPIPDDFHDLRRCGDVDEERDAERRAEQENDN
jgi:hypothetical protein